MALGVFANVTLESQTEIRTLATRAVNPSVMTLVFTNDERRVTP
jgi:hypothetical protein